MQYLPPELVGHSHELVHASAAALARVPSFGAPRAAPHPLERGERNASKAAPPILGRALSLLATLANGAHESLRQHRLDGTRHQIRRHVEIEETRQGAWRVVGVERR